MLTFRWQATVADAIVVRRRLLRPLLVRTVALGFASSWVSSAAVGWVTGSVGLAWRCAALWPLVVIFALALEPGRQIRRLRRGGLLALGPMEVQLERSGVTWVQEGALARLRWGAFRWTSRDRRGLWLDLGLSQRLFVPARALGSAELGVLERWRADPQPPPPLPRGDGWSSWQLAGDLGAADWIRAVDSAFGATTGRRWRLAGAVALLSLTVGLLSLLMTRSTLLLAGWVTLVASWTTAQAWVAPAYRRWVFRREVQRDPTRLPIGPAEWHVGPAGVWVSSSRGTARYGWSHIGSVDRDAEQVRMTVGVAVLVIPAQVFASDAEVDRFVAETRAWIDSAPGLREGRPQPPRGEVAVPDDPFAPPPERR